MDDSSRIVEARTQCCVARLPVHRCLRVPCRLVNTRGAECCAGWDHWIRSDARVHKHRECIFPEIPRVQHIGIEVHRLNRFLCFFVVAVPVLSYSFAIMGLMLNGSSASQVRSRVLTRWCRAPTCMSRKAQVCRISTPSNKGSQASILRSVS